MQNRKTGMKVSDQISGVLCAYFQYWLVPNVDAKGKNTNDAVRHLPFDQSHCLT